MLPHFHLILSAILALVFVLLNFHSHFVVLFLLASVLIDIDHYFLYISMKKDIDFFKAYTYFRKDNFIRDLQKTEHKEVFVVFHTIEFLILLLLLSLFLKELLAVFLGCIFHVALDWIYDLTKKRKGYKRAFSILYYKSKLNKNG